MRFCAIVGNRRRTHGNAKGTGSAAEGAHWRLGLVALVLASQLACTPDATPKEPPPMSFDVSRVFGPQDQRDRIDERFPGDAPSRQFLQHAAQARLAAMADQVRGGYDINSTGRDGVTPAMAYVSYVRPVRADVLAQMIALGADITRPMSNNMSLLNGLSRVQDPGVLDALLAAGVSPDTRLPAIGETFLLVAIREGNTALALGLLKAGADPNLASAEGHAPLRTAADLGDWVVAHALIKAGAKPPPADADRARMVHALATRPPAADTPQGQAHAAVSQWLSQQGPAMRP